MLFAIIHVAQTQEALPVLDPRESHRRVFERVRCSPQHQARENSSLTPGG